MTWYLSDKYVKSQYGDLSHDLLKTRTSSMSEEKTVSTPTLQWVLYCSSSETMEHSTWGSCHFLMSYLSVIILVVMVTRLLVIGCWSMGLFWLPYLKGFLSPNMRKSVFSLLRDFVSSGSTLQSNRLHCVEFFLASQTVLLCSWGLIFTFFYGMSCSFYGYYFGYHKKAFCKGKLFFFIIFFWTLNLT